MRSMSDLTRVQASSGLSVSTPTCTVLYGLLRKVQERHTITKARHTLHSLDTPFHAHLRLEHPHKTPFQILGFEELSAVSASQAGRDWCGLCRTGSHIEVSKSPNGTGSQFDRIKRPFKNLVSFCRIVTTFSAKSGCRSTLPGEDEHSTLPGSAHPRPDPSSHNAPLPCSLTCHGYPSPPSAPRP